MKAVSVRQPWAWAILAGEILYLPRARRVDYRGPLLIHVAQRDDQHGYFTLLNRGLAIPKRLPHGGFVGRAQLLFCVTRRTAWQHDARYITTPYAWILGSPEAFPLVPASGRLGLWDVDDQRELALT